MLPILRRTVPLLRRQPILWGPLLFVTLALVGLDALRRLVQFQIVRWLMSSHTSVLSSTPEYQSTYLIEMKAVMIGAPLAWAAVVFGLFLHALAFIMTAALIRSLLIGTDPSLRNALDPAMRRKVPALWFSLKLFLLVQFFEPLVWLLLSRIPQIRGAMMTQSGLLLFGIPIHLGWQVFAAIYFAPAALALLYERAGQPSSPLAIRQARILAIATVFATAIFTYLLVLARPSLLTKLQSPLLLSISTPVIASVPLLLLYISLALLSFEETSPNGLG